MQVLREDQQWVHIDRGDANARMYDLLLFSNEIGAAVHSCVWQHHRPLHPTSALLAHHRQELLRQVFAVVASDTCVSCRSWALDEPC